MFVSLVVVRGDWFLHPVEGHDDWSLYPLEGNDWCLGHEAGVFVCVDISLNGDVT